MGVFEFAPHAKIGEWGPWGNNGEEVSNTGEEAPSRGIGGDDRLQTGKRGS